MPAVTIAVFGVRPDGPIGEQCPGASTVSSQQPIAIWLLLGGLLLSGCRQEATVPPAGQELPQVMDVSRPVPRPADDPWFETMTRGSGVDFAYRNGDDAGRHTLLETIGGGAGLIDYDADGDCDLFLLGGGAIPQASGTVSGHPPALFQQQDEWQFRRVDAAAGITEGRHYSHGCATADFNCDGFSDLAVAGFGGVLLYVNKGDGTFAEVARDSGLVVDGWCTALAWSDIDKDGLSDLFVVRYVEWSLAKHIECATAKGEPEACQPTAFPPATSVLLRNRGDGTFVNESKKRGITRTGNGLGVAAADLNADGLCEFYVANDETDNLLYGASESGHYEETGQLAGVATDEFGYDEGSMGLAVGDYDGDHRPDLFVTNFEREDNSLYRNEGGGMFLHSSQRTGLSGPSRMYVGFGTTLTDFNSDGWPDLLVANGHVFPTGGLAGYRQPSQLFRNEAGRRFVEVSQEGGEYFTQRHVSRGFTVGDLDDDGAPDVVVVHQNDPVELLRNCRPPSRFVRVHLRGTHSNPDAIGAEVWIQDGQRRITQWVTSGCGYCSQNDPRLLFALNAAGETVAVHVRWPSGMTEEFRDVATRRTHQLIEGHGAAAVEER